VQLELPSEGYGSPANPTRRRIELFADWLEAQVYALSSALSQPEIVDRLEGTGLVASSDDAWNLVGETFTVCRLRRSTLGVGYPFAIAGKSIELVDDTRAGYVFCLLSSLPEQFKPLRTAYPQDFRDTFETLVAAALRRIMPNWRVLQTGWAQSADPTKGAVVRSVAELCRGRFVDPLVFPHANDAQVDVALARDFEDGRSAFPVLLGQCATGVTDWKSKMARPNLDRWRKAIIFSSQPLKLFAVPFALDDESFKEASDESDGIVLDRIRICAVQAEDGDAALRHALQAWIAAATQLLPAVA
jgi:hypothetical protein